VKPFVIKTSGAVPPASPAGAFGRAVALAGGGATPPERR